MFENKVDHAECVEVNIFVKCKDNSWKKEKESPCVVVNINVECDECCGKRKNPCDEY